MDVDRLSKLALQFGSDWLITSLSGRHGTKTIKLLKAARRFADSDGRKVSENYMSASELLVIQMEFVVKNGGQSISVVLRRQMTSEPNKVVQLCLHEARVLGGIWDLSGKVFHPWHEVSQITWRPDGATAEDWEHLGFRAAMKHLELTGRATSEDPYRIPEDERITS